MGIEDQHQPESPNSEERIGSTEAEVDAAQVPDPHVPESDESGPPPPMDEETDEQASDTQSALDAIDSVEQNAQSLIESAIDGLLDDNASDEESAQSEPADAEDEEISLEAIEAMLAKNNDGATVDDTGEPDLEPEPEPADSAVDDTTTEEDAEVPQLSDEAIDAELDALERIQEPEQETGAEHEIEAEIDEPVVDDDATDVEVLEEAEFDSSIETSDETERDDEAISESEISTTGSQTVGTDAIEQATDDPAEVSSDLLDEIAEGFPDAAEESAPSELDDASAYNDTDLLDEIANDLMSDHQSEASSPIDDEEPAQEEPQVSVPESEPDAIDEVLSAIGDDDISQDPPSEIGEESQIEAGAGADQDSAEELDSNAIDAASTLEDLDATLAGIGDDLLAGDFETPDGELVDSSSLEEHDASALMSQLNIDDLGLGHEGVTESGDGQAAEETETSTSQAEVPAPTPKPAPKPAPVTKDATPVASVEDEPELAEAESIWQTGRRVSITYARLAWDGLKTHGAPFGAKVVLLVNTPVKDRPAQLRDSIGYLALWTLLLSMILWVYLVFVRVTPTPTPTQAPTRVLAPGEVVDPLRSADSTP